jgi:hypothetical protein
LSRTIRHGRRKGKGKGVISGVQSCVPINRDNSATESIRPRGEGWIRRVVSQRPLSR